MNKYKVMVYAICKNEIKHVARWMESMGEADGIYVLDTGSEDESPNALRALGAHVSEAAVIPWRFDTARNLSLALVPDDADICVCCDLDEVFTPGWRQRLEECWFTGCRRVKYPFVYSVSQNGDESFFYRSLIHSRRGFKWEYPIHEVLTCIDGREISTLCDDIKLYHLPDREKSRESYLPLLELAHEEAPDDMRLIHYLGREYMYRGLHEKALPLLELHGRRCPWPPERSASLRYLGRCLEALGQDGAAQAYLDAIDAYPSAREPYVELSLFFSKNKRYAESLDNALAALAITEPDPVYFNEGYAWGSLPWDLAAVAAYNLGYVARALLYGKKALDLSPDDQRLKRNMELYSAADKPQ